jgi:hypothetical protein
MKLPWYVLPMAFFFCWPTLILADHDPRDPTGGCANNAEVAAVWTDLRQKYTKEQAAEAFLKSNPTGSALASTIKAINLIWDNPTKTPQEVAEEFYEWCVGYVAKQRGTGI